MKTFSATGNSSGDEEAIVTVDLTYDGTDKAAFNRQVPNVALCISDVSSDATTRAVLTYAETRDLVHALNELAAEAGEWNYKIEPNVGNGRKRFG